MQLNYVALKRITKAIASWNRSDLEGLLSSCRDDAVLSSCSGSEGREWVQGLTEIKRHLQRFREIHPNLKVVDCHSGSQFFTAILSDEARFVTFHIEPDARGAIKRIIVCSSIWSPRKS